MNYIKAGCLDEFPVNTCRLVTLPNCEPVLVINLDEEFHALEGRCGGGYSLEKATVVADEGKVLCPQHGWEIDLARRVCTAEPDCVLKIYPVRVEGDQVLIGCE